MLKKPVVSPDKWILRRSSWTIACTWITHPAQNAAAHPNKRPPIRIQTEGLHTYGTRGSSFFSTRENQFKRWGWNCFGKTDCCKKLGKSVTYRFETWCVGNVLLKTVFLGIFRWFLGQIPPFCDKTVKLVCDLQRSLELTKILRQTSRSTHFWRF